MATVVRVQNEDGIGPYLAFPKTGEVREITNADINYDKSKRPNPFEEGFKHRIDDYYCGFKDKQQLRKWFTQQELEVLKRNGFDVVILDDVTIVAELGHQTIFKRKVTNGKERSDQS